jgi:hypothetical protein
MIAQQWFPGEIERISKLVNFIARKSIILVEKNWF